MRAFLRAHQVEWLGGLAYVAEEHLALDTAPLPVKPAVAGAAAGVVGAGAAGTGTAPNTPGRTNFNASSESLVLGPAAAPATKVSTTAGAAAPSAAASASVAGTPAAKGTKSRSPEFSDDVPKASRTPKESSKDPKVAKDSKTVKAKASGKSTEAGEGLEKSPSGELGDAKLRTRPKRTPEDSASSLRKSAGDPNDQATRKRLSGGAQDLATVSSVDSLPSLDEEPSDAMPASAAAPRSTPLSSLDERRRRLRASLGPGGLDA